MKHVAIIPARNEATRIASTLQSLLGQTLVPDRIYVVDDGSSDDTAKIVEMISKQNDIVTLLRKENRGSRAMGGGVVETFNVGYEMCKHDKVTYVSKLDADLIFPPDYFEKLLRFMDQDPKIGAASGILYDQIGQRLVRLRTPRNHVSGPLKTIRKNVFEEIGGFLPVLGWDIIDLVKMRSLGYKTAALEDLRVIHTRQHASAEGLLRGNSEWGRGAYVIGSHPLFVFARGIYRMLEPPYITGGIAFWWGYLSAAATRIPRISDKELMKALRKEQLLRLVHINRLPDR